MKNGSLTSRLLSLMLVLILLSCLLALYAILTVSFSLDDANSINMAGSLRMQSYRLLVSAQEVSIEQGIAMFEDNLNTLIHSRSQVWYAPSTLAQQYQLVANQWLEMKHLLQGQQLDAYKASLPDFVSTINTLVLKLETFASYKLKYLAFSQMLGLFIMLCVAFFALFYTRKNLVFPLQDIVKAANQISAGNFAITLPKTHSHELNALNAALDKSAKELSLLYQGLEKKVKAKTLALTRSNAELNLLYDNLFMLHGASLNYAALKKSINQLRDHQALANLRLVIIHTDGTQDIIEADNGWPTDSSQDNSPYNVCFPLVFEQHTLGQLEVISTVQVSTLLLENFAMMLARAIVIHNASEQRQQLALFEERSVIARELHDSIGQLLSFLKIQVNLLNKALVKTGTNATIDNLVGEINIGVSTAYVQLRELLSTFRLKLTDPDLHHALTGMLEQLQSQTTMTLNLDYRLAGHLIAANQHIHILQIIREASLNAIKHAKGNAVLIKCYQDDNESITIEICDDGVGISQQQDPLQHFGIGIMHERAKKLNGTLELSNLSDANPALFPQATGTRVTLCFEQQQEPLNG
jgi:two-component system nitrate/nitrite sensor histidine kinase NarQ